MTKSSKPPFSLSVNHDDPSLNYHAYAFFDHLLKKLDVDHKKTGIIAVCHSYESSLPYIASLPKLGEVLAIIPKHSSSLVHPEVLEHLKIHSDMPIRGDITKETLKNTSKAVDFLNHCQRQNRHKNLLILDHGGYFAPAVYELPSLGSVLGATEFTDNGHKRYQKQLGLFHLTG